MPPILAHPIYHRYHKIGIAALNTLPNWPSTPAQICCISYQAHVHVRNRNLSRIGEDSEILVRLINLHRVRRINRGCDT